MTSKSNEPPSARGPEDMERRGRTRRETVMTQEATVIDEDRSDDDDYQPINEGDRTVLLENGGATPMIDAFDYWDVMLAMDKQAKMNTNQVTDDVIREEGYVWARPTENCDMRETNLAEKRVEELTSKLDVAYRERDQSILTLMNAARQSTPVPERNDSRVLRRVVSLETRTEPIRREGSHLPYTSLGRFDNPNFPDAPVFSGDRDAFDSWRDKVYDKLMNSAAQYLNEEQRIAYIRSRTDAQYRPDHPRSFQSAEDALEALEKIYGDKNKRKGAINELRTLRMGRMTFDDFYADFARCAAEVGYAEDAMIPLLKNAISNELARQRIGLQKPADFYDLVNFYRDVDHEMRDYERRLPSRVVGTGRTNQRYERSRPRQTPFATRPEGYVPRSVDCALLARHGRFYKCGEHGHRIHECINPQMKEMPRLGRGTAKVNNAMMESDIDDESTVAEGKEMS
ncbi:hypothetical protein N7475_003638 [Penicillium sp. IBT 31633x]|nr:hypothetical protein N7475_003638 [Penicillium sp. IBT 31633x]